MAELDLAEPLPVNGSNYSHTSGQPPGSQALESGTVVDYLSRLLNATLGASQNELEAEGSLLSLDRVSDTVKLCTRFLSEAQVALYAQKVSASFTGDSTLPEVHGPYRSGAKMVAAYCCVRKNKLLLHSHCRPMRWSVHCCIPGNTQETSTCRLRSPP